MTANGANSLITEREALDRVETLLGYLDHLHRTAFDQADDAAEGDNPHRASEQAANAAATIVIAQDYRAEIARIIGQLSEASRPAPTLAAVSTAH